MHRFDNFVHAGARGGSTYCQRSEKQDHQRAIAYMTAHGTKHPANQEIPAHDAMCARPHESVNRPSNHTEAFFPRMAKPLAGEDVFRGFIPRNTDGGKN